ncbi:MAG: cysteine synthase family protein [Balneolaceae bacterium]|nr:cysteine synthase family protein [Balneolaceae bacterium]
MNQSPFTLLHTIGNTPLVPLLKITADHPGIELYAKLEFMNPGLSIKDRIVRHILDKAEQSGELQPGGTIVENTSGNTGAATAMIGALKGYKVILTMPDKVSTEKQNSLKAYGAEVRVFPTISEPGTPNHYVQAALDLAKELGAFRINQYDNHINPEAHYLTTGPEIWDQMDQDVDVFVSSGSTGGTITGTGGYLKEKNASIQIVMPDPIGSIYYHYWKTGQEDPSKIGTYEVEGVGEDHLAKAIDFSVIDDVIPFNDEQAFRMGRRLAHEEGILGGGTGGANVWGALEFAKTYFPEHQKIHPGKPLRIATVIPDSGVKYLSKMYNDEWMAKQGYKV